MRWMPVGSLLAGSLLAGSLVVATVSPVLADGPNVGAPWVVTVGDSAIRCTSTGGGVNALGEPNMSLV
jgi:hypothetical protein